MTKNIPKMSQHVKTFQKHTENDNKCENMSKSNEGRQRQVDQPIPRARSTPTTALATASATSSRSGSSPYSPKLSRPYFPTTTTTTTTTTTSTASTTITLTTTTTTTTTTIRWCPSDFAVFRLVVRCLCILMCFIGSRWFLLVFVGFYCFSFAPQTSVRNYATAVAPRSRTPRCSARRVA